MCNVLLSKYGLCSYDDVDAKKSAVFQNLSAAPDALRAGR